MSEPSYDIYSPSVDLVFSYPAIEMARAAYAYVMPVPPGANWSGRTESAMLAIGLGTCVACAMVTTRSNMAFTRIGVVRLSHLVDRHAATSKPSLKSLLSLDDIIELAFQFC